MTTAIDEGVEMARSLDESLSRILNVEILLESACDDLPLPAALAETIAGLGLQGIAVAEDSGGLGLELGDRVRLAAVLGRRLVPAAVRNEAFGVAPALALAAPADARAAELLARLLDGGSSVGLALASREGGDLLAQMPEGAEALVVLDLDRITVFETAEGFPSVPLAGLDPGQGLRRVKPDSAEPVVTVIGERAARVRREFELALICEAFGSAERTLELSAEYADEREQFGRPISSFQAVGHLLAEMKLGLETSRAGIGRFVDLDGESHAPETEIEQWRATLAHSVPAAARRACEGAIQVHGGIGFSWELGLHLHYRRILADQYMLGGESASAEVIGSAYLDRREAA
ncbi:MAG TPA: acyl-CoA dehydrogenase family protein [Solirubrobacterales bacterium]|nr:acyl-CoA dehydrogenase family protein [Solirubrobacterales bacterium]